MKIDFEEDKNFVPEFWNEKISKLLEEQGFVNKIIKKGQKGLKV